MLSSLKSFGAKCGRQITALAGRALFWVPSRKKNEEHTAKADKIDHELLLSVTSPRRMPGLRQIRYISRILSATERKLVAILFLICVLSIGAVTFLTLQSKIEHLPAVGGTLTEALIGEPIYINPLDAPANDVDQDLASLLFSGLYRMDETQPVFDLAESAEWSEDGKKLTVHLRTNAYFHSGDQVIAEDVLYTVDAIQDPTRGSPLAGKFKGVQTALIDSQTIEFTLENPNPLFEYALTVGILPARLWQEVPPANARLSNLNVKPIGSGPYRFKSFKRDGKGIIRSYTLERTDNWYGEPTFIKTLIFQFYPDRTQAEEALKADLVDTLAFSPFGSEIQESQRRTAVQVQLPQETIAFFNVKRDIVKDDAIRKALTGVVDRQEIIDAWKGRAEAVSGPYPFLKSAPSIMTLDEARAILEEAGWKINDELGVRTKNSTSTPLEITILTSEMSSLNETAETLKRRWSLLGVRVKVVTVSPEELLHRATRERDADIIVTNILLDSEQNLFPFWWSGQATDRGFNISNLADRDVDTALEAIQNATSTNDILAKQQKLSDTILEMHPAVFLVRPASTYFVSSKIKGVNDIMIIAVPSDRFHALTTWYIKTGWQWNT
ncbi:MAG: ABC transporter substrate-binding protein [bacterium]|nr:ABC transporter substrate-binding protein [bacterium]